MNKIIIDLVLFCIKTILGTCIIIYIICLSIGELESIGLHAIRDQILASQAFQQSQQSQTNTDQSQDTTQQ